MTEHEFHQATDAETREMARLLQTHTACGRIALDELVTALQFARSRGYTIYKSDDE